MALFGYVRVSGSEQNFALQEHVLHAAGCDAVLVEKANGTSRFGRTEFETLLSLLRRSDVSSRRGLIARRAA